MMMNRFFLSFVFVLLLCGNCFVFADWIQLVQDYSSSSSSSGSSASSPPYSGSGSGSGTFNLLEHLSTMTPYQPQQTTYDPPPEGCYPVYFNLLARHGSRQPVGLSGYQSLQQHLTSVGQYITDPRFEWMRNWTDPFLPDYLGDLDTAGIFEHYHFGQRNRKNYNTLLNDSFSSHFYDIQSTVVVRTAVSAAAHMYGLFEGTGVLNGYDAAGSYSYGPSDDDLLRFFDICPLYTQAQDSPAATLQATLYQPTVATIVPQIMTLLNLTEEQWNMTYKDMSNMWSACGYQISVYNISDQWCSLFDEEAVEILEFYSDLTTFYTHGPGFEVNYQSATLLLQDFAAHFEAVINGSDPLSKGRLRFGHAETVMPFVTLLNLFQDPEPLMWNSTWASKRLWRTSNITPFTGNLAMILYNCTELDDTFKVKALHNEAEIVLPPCTEEGLYCSYDTFTTGYAVELNYDFDTVCGITTPTSPTSTPTPTPASTPTSTPTPIPNSPTYSPVSSPNPGSDSGSDSSSGSSPSSSGSASSPGDHEEERKFDAADLLGVALGSLLLGFLITSIFFIAFIRKNFIRRPRSYDLVA